MKKGFLVLLLFCTTAFVFAQDQSGALWTASAIKIDGNASDWNLPLKNYDDNTRLFYGIKNDDQKLYLCFQTKDQTIQGRIMRSGMKIILVSKINGKHKVIIDFPLPYKNPQQDGTGGETHDRRDFSQMHQGMKSSFQTADSVMEVKGFATKDGIIPANDTSGLNVSINWDKEGVLTYEISVPYSEMFGKDYDPKDFSKEIALNVIINGRDPNTTPFITRETKTVSGINGSPMNTSDRGGHRGDRMGGSQFQSGRESMVQKTEMKEKFKLAAKS